MHGYSDNRLLGFHRSTYSYLSVMRIEELAKANGIKFRWRPFSVRSIMVEQNNEGRRRVLCLKGLLEMDKVTRYGAMAAFCRQRAKMVGENEHFWLTEADSWAERLSSVSVDTLQKKTVVRRARGRKASDPSQSPPA